MVSLDAFPDGLGGRAQIRGYWLLTPFYFINCLNLFFRLKTKDIKTIDKILALL